MMLDDNDFQVRIVDSVHSMASNGRLSWTESGRDSYRTKAGNLQIDVDKSAVGDRVMHVLWVWAENGTLAGRLDGSSLPPPVGGGVKSYQDVIKNIFALAKKSVKASLLKDVADTLDAIRQSNTPEGPDKE